MRLKSFAKTVAFGLTLLAAIGAFASNKGSFHTSETVVINGQALPAGDYQVQWQGSGSNVELSFMKGKKEIAKVTATQEDLQQAPINDEAIVSHSNGQASVSEIRFAGKKTAFALGGSDRASMGDASK
jgi:hypothetical protein